MAKLLYRPWSVEHKPSLERLFAEDTNWGQLTAELWRDFVLEAPLGPPLGTVAIDAATGEVVGQFMFHRMRISIDGTEVSAFRPRAFILGRRVRHLLTLLSPNDHPVTRMYLSTLDELRAAGGKLVYIVPDPRWARFLKRFPRFTVGKFPLFSRACPLDTDIVLDPGFEASVLTSWDERVDALWRRVMTQQSVSVVRDATLFRWKVRDADWEVTQVQRNGNLVGLVAARRKAGIRQWLIGDVLAENMGAALRNTIAAAMDLGNRRSRETSPKESIRKFAILATASMEPVVRALGFTRDQYDFLLAVESLDPAVVPQASVAPERWYLSAND